MTKIISMSVWGKSPEYSIGAIKNAKIAKELFPDWKCRIFVDGSVPTHYVNEMLSQENVELAQIDDSAVYGMFWRFYSMFQNDDDIVISRDSDSRLSKRELRCINEWIDSGKKFSIIKDHYRHYDWPMLGGMWGMRGSLNDNILNIMQDYSHKHSYAMDQVFLKNHIWKIAENDCLIHGFLEVEWMKETRDPDHFIGQGYTENDEPIYRAEPDGTKRK